MNYIEQLEALQRLHSRWLEPDHEEEDYNEEQHEEENWNDDER